MQLGGDGSILFYTTETVETRTSVPQVIQDDGAASAAAAMAGESETKADEGLDSFAIVEKIEYVEKTVAKRPLDPKLRRIVTATLDADTKARILRYEDGRLAIAYTDGQREVYYPDRTMVTTHASGLAVFVRKELDPHGANCAIPAVEVDLEIDDISRGHAKGLQVERKL